MKRLDCVSTSSIFVAILSIWLGGIPAVLAANGGMAGQEALDEEVADEDEEDHQKMLELSAEGNELYEAGQFEEAAEVYQRAWEAYPQPILLKNQMITRYLLEECETAIELGEQFLETGEATEKDEEDVEAVFGECSLDLAEEAVADEEFAEASRWLDHGEPYLFEARLREEAEQLREQVEVEAAADDLEHIDDPGTSPREIAGWSLGGAGGATLLAAGLWHIRWERRISDYNPDNPDPEIEARGDTVRWAIPMMYGVGATAALVGGGMLLWPRISGDDDQPAATIHPDIGADRAGAVLRLNF